MKMRILLLSVFILAAAVMAAWPSLAKAFSGPAEPQVYSSPINGGCYIAAANECRLHVDPFTINFTPGSTLSLVQLQANGTTIYDYRTDVSNPPYGTGTTGQYSPSLVALDFAAECGKTYTMNLLGQDSLDTNRLNMGQTASFTCPAGIP